MITRSDVTSVQPVVPAGSLCVTAPSPIQPAFLVNEAPIWSISIEIHGKFLLGRLLLSPNGPMYGLEILYQHFGYVKHVLMFEGQGHQVIKQFNFQEVGVFLSI